MFSWQYQISDTEGIMTCLTTKQKNSSNQDPIVHEYNMVLYALNSFLGGRCFSVTKICYKIIDFLHTHTHTQNKRHELTCGSKIEV